jgi:hypothetical protein
MEVPMQKWPFADFTHINVEYFRFSSEKSTPAPMWEYLTVQAVFVAEDTVQFFDHYLNQYKRQRSELDAYLQKLAADGWKLISNHWADRTSYQFREYSFRRAKA